MRLPRYQPKPRVARRIEIEERRQPPEPPHRGRRGLSTSAIGVLIVVGALAFVVMQTRLAHRTVETVIDIEASAAKVWGVLADFGAYPSWNPFIRRIEGAPIQGARIEIEIAAPGMDSMTFDPVLLVVAPGRELRWRGQLFIPGIFDGNHVFIIEELSPVSVRFHHAERFTGLVVAFGPDSIFDATRAGFDAMNRALKVRAESIP